MDVDSLVESLKQKKQDAIAIPTCVSSVIFFSQCLIQSTA